MKKVLSILLIATLVFSLASISVFAVDPKASIKLIEGDFAVIDPDPEVPGYEGIKTTQMDFGIHKITGSTVTYPSIQANSQGGDHAVTGTPQPVGLLITDARGADGQWTVNVQGEVFQDGATPPKATLAGYTITLTPVGTILGPVGDPNTPVASSPTITASAGPLRVLTSNAAGTTGTWGANWDAKLTILGGTESAGAHIAVVKWSIVAGA